MIALATDLWRLFAPIHSQLLSLFFTIVGAVIVWIFRARVKLIWGRSNNSIHFVQSNDARTEIYCEKYYVQNTGRKPATDVQFVMSFKPDDFSMFPPRHYDQLTNPEGHFVVKIPFISPRELLIIDVVYIQKRAATIEAVVCSEATGKNVFFVTQRRFGNLVSVTAAILFFLGVAFIIQAVLSLLVGY